MAERASEPLLTCEAVLAETDFHLRSVTVVLHPHHSVVTVDRQDFRVYRRNKREMIPLVCPPVA